MGKKLAMGIGAAVLVFIIIFCLVPTNTVSYAKTEQYQDTETYDLQEAYTAYMPVHTKYRPSSRFAVATHREVVAVTQYHAAPVSTAVVKTREVTVEKRVSMLDYLLNY